MVFLFRLQPPQDPVHTDRALGASGLAQWAELFWLLHGTAQKREVEDVKAALQHNLGLGGACVVTMDTKA